MQHISRMPLIRNTVKDQVLSMASDVREQLISDLQKAACFSTCLNESIDINDHARLTEIFCYAVGDIMTQEQVKLVSLPGRAQRLHIYNVMMEVFLSEDIRAEKVVSISNDGHLVW